MSDKIYIYSTLTNDNEYGPYVEGGADLPYKPQTVVIRGGANRADRDNRLFTPKGEVTEITPEQLALCEADPIFKLHKENGYIMVTSHNADPDDISVDMTAKSKDAPLTPEVIETENDTKPDDKKQEVISNVGPAPERAKSQTRRRGRRARNGN